MQLIGRDKNTLFSANRQAERARKTCAAHVFPRACEPHPPPSRTAPFVPGYAAHSERVRSGRRSCSEPAPYTDVSHTVRQRHKQLILNAKIQSRNETAKTEPAGGRQARVCPRLTYAANGAATPPPRCQDAPSQKSTSSIKVKLLQSGAAAYNSLVPGGTPKYLSG